MGQLAGWLQEVARGKCLRLKRLKQLFIDFLTKQRGFMGVLAVIVQ